MWTTDFLKRLAVYLGGGLTPVSIVFVASRLELVQEAEDSASYCGEMGLQTKYSKLLQQPRVKGLTPP